MTLQPVPAHILSITPETPTIARITLRIDDGAPFAFVPGQWIDFGVQLGDQLEVGGYSLASAPAQLPDIELGVRHNPRHTVSHWLHTEAKPGDTVLVQGGQGNCVWTPTRDDEVIFVVGGIGITPPLSMLRAALATTTPFQARMHYSARTHDELAFLTDLQKLAADPRFVLHTTVTRETPENNDRFGAAGREHIGRGPATTAVVVLALCAPHHSHPRNARE
ncbi:MAG: FAD-dependent oxidoreductase, partial [Myxococcota bacterium]